MTSSRKTRQFPGDTGKSKPVTSTKLPSTLEYSYPSEWFATHKAKPPTSLRFEVTDEDLMKLAEDFENEFLDFVVSVHIAKTFLYLYARKYLIVKSEEDWTSYGITLCKRGDKICPMDLLHIETGSAKLFGGRTRQGAANEDKLKWIVILILSVYRISATNKENHKKKLTTNLENFLLGAGCPVPSQYISAAAKHTFWSNDDGYRKMIAAYDMFLSKFPREFSDSWAFRFGTVLSRYRDCTALTVLSKTSQLLGYDSVGDLADMVFYPTLGASILRIYVKDEEMDLRDSYFPYLRDLAIVTKSPYSVTANPELHLFCHTIGCCIGVEQSRSARLVSLNQSHQMVLNGMLVAYASRRNIKPRKMFSVDGNEYVPKKVEAAVLISPDADSQLPLCVTPDDYYDWLVNGGDTSDPELKKFVLKQKSNLTQVRPNTVGEYFAKTYCLP